VVAPHELIVGQAEEVYSVVVGEGVEEGGAGGSQDDAGERDPLEVAGEGGQSGGEILGEDVESWALSWGSAMRCVPREARSLRPRRKRSPMRCTALPMGLEANRISLSSRRTCACGRSQEESIQGGQPRQKRKDGRVERHAWSMYLGVS